MCQWLDTSVHLDRCRDFLVGCSSLTRADLGLDDTRVGITLQDEELCAIGPVSSQNPTFHRIATSVSVMTTVGPTAAVLLGYHIPGPEKPQDTEFKIKRKCCVT